MRKLLLLPLTLFLAMFAMAQEPATFEDVQLGGSGIWQPPIGANEMSSGGWLFTNNTQNGYWGGFTASNRTDLNQSGLDAQYTAAAGCGYDGSSQYAVAYTMGVQTDVHATDGQLHTVTGCYVTNNLWAYQDMLQGGYGEPPYGGITGNDPDWFKVTATGKNASGQTVGTLDFYLADFRFANNEEDYILNTWEWFDLSPLGNVATISFSLSSSRGSGYNMITPAYFCMDNFNGGGAAPDQPPHIANPVQDVVFNQYPQTIQVNLNGVATDPDDPDENITYSIVSNSNPGALNATMNGKILVMTRQNANQATANLTMRATSDGQSVDFTVHVIINEVVDNPPYIVNPVQDVVFDEYPQTIQVNLNSVATDPDDPDENITYSIVSNSNPNALNATMNGKILVMTRQNANQATVDLTMRATSDGQHVDFTVHVIINAVVAPMSGIYTINANAAQNPDFTSFNEAVSALSIGIVGEVVFEVAPGSYDEFVTLNTITGANASNRVIFRGMGSNNQQVVLTSNAGYTQNSTLTLDGSDYVTFENMTLESTSENNAVVVTLRGGLSNDRFENVRFMGCYSEASNTDNDKNLVYRVSGGWMDTDNAFVGCEFVNGFIGLYYQGTDMTQFNDGLLVQDCSFTNQCSKSIYTTFTDHVTLSGNTIENTNDTHTDYNAIDMFRCRYGCLVENNVMTVNHPNKYATVVKLRPCTGSDTEPIIVRNNIVDFQGAASSWCYSFDNADSDYIYFVHNTGRCSGSGVSGNLMVQKEWSNLYVYNNLFVNETDGYVFRFNNESEARYCDYNRVSFRGENVGIFAGTDCATLADWTAASGFDAHTATCTPQFAGNGDLHLTSPEGLTVANPLDYATTDIDGEERPNTPCAGADEYNDAIYSIGESTNNGCLSVYPNPTQGMVTITVNDAHGFGYQVFDFTGKSVLKGKAQDNATSFDLSGLSKGVYFISVVTENKHLTQKVVVY